MSSYGSVDFGQLVNSGNFNEIFPVNYINYNNKLMPLQGWTTVQGGTFTTLVLTAYGPVQQDQKTYTFPRFILDYEIECEYGGGGGGGVQQKNAQKGSTLKLVDPVSEGPIPIHYESDIPRSFYSGDFNGDGLTDIVAIEKSFSYPYQIGCATYSNTYSGGRTFFINLDKRETSNFANIAGHLTTSNSSVIKVGDFDGDGKSDIYVFDAGKVNVYGLNDSKRFVLIYQSINADANIAIDRPISMGDYNGDGKTDFIIPKAIGSSEWYKFSSTGTSFYKELQNYSGFAYLQNTSIYSYSVIPTDYNNDGKTDLLFTSASRGAGWSVGSLSVTCYVNKNGTFSNTAGNYYSSTISNHPDIYPNALPIFLSSDQPNRKLDLCFINNNRVFKFNSAKDFSKEKLLKSIKTGNGVLESITYLPLSPNSKEDFRSIYSDSRYTENYPNFDITEMPDQHVVTKLEVTSATTYKKQLFSYYGAVSNVEGRGFLGFRSIAKTNWFDTTQSVVSTISNYDVNLQGANTENYSVLGTQNANGTSSPSNFITKSVLNYTSSLGANKVFNIKNTSSQQFNGLENTSSETTTVYDIYNNPTQSTTLLKEGGATVQTTVSNVTYDDKPYSSPYYVGRPTNKTQSVSINGDSTTSEEQFVYTNHLLTQIKKKGNNTDFITEDNGYDAFGNITKKTITATGLTPRITNYVYDASGRFLIKSIDIESLSTSFDYNLSSGVLNFEINPYGLKTTYEYDSWFKKTKTIDYLGKKNTYVYTRSGNVNTLITATGDDGSVSQDLFDDLGRKIKTGVKDINGILSNVDFYYDSYDRNFKVSEPYNSGSSSQFNTTEYDVYGRVIKSTSFTGNIVTFSYSGLTTTVNDGSKTKASTKNAIGKVITMTDTPGGTINYTYFANGNLKSTNYDGVITSIEQDGWGRKTKLIDPSAGTYRYAYNGFGELTSETTLNGTTTYELDAYGKLKKKTISGPYSDSVSDYVYDGSSKLLLSSTFNNIKEGIVTNYKYTYDTNKRITTTEEETPFYGTKFTKIVSYDLFGRVEFETSTATILGKSSAKRIKNVYKNGSPWQIIDDATQQVLWQTNEVNARGQLTKASLGNGIDITNKYDQYGFANEFKHDKTGGSPFNVMTLTTNFDAKKGNLLNRTNSLFTNGLEVFEYDSLDRLIKYPDALGQQVVQDYDARGRITKNIVGTYNYDAAKPYQNKEILLTPEAYGYYYGREGIFNDSMEEQKDWQKPDSGVYFDKTNAHTGSTSFKISNTNTTEKVAHSNLWIPINNTVETEYTYSAWVYTDNPQAELFLFMKTPTETGYFSLVHSVATNVKNQWVLLEGKFKVPANITKLNIRLDNNGQGNVWFDDVEIRKSSNAASQIRNLNIDYSVFKSPVKIEETGVDIINFAYNYSNSRYAMFYGSLDVLAKDRPYRKFYSADGTMEIKENRVTGVVEFVTYIGGDGYSAPIVLKSDGTTQNYLYLHRDYQGSILAIINATGTIVEKRLFDAWGSIIKVQDGAGNTLTGLTILDRGYTGHEHLQSVGLINMNGRIYDPKLHRFLQPDNFVQDPSNTQNYNRYGYVLNNPLKYIDPSGEYGENPNNGLIDGGTTGIDTEGVKRLMKDLNRFWDNATHAWNSSNTKDWFKKAGNNISDGFKRMGSLFKSDNKPVNTDQGSYMNTLLTD